MRSSFSISLLYHAYVYLEFLILACTIYILAPDFAFMPNKLDLIRDIALGTDNAERKAYSNNKYGLVEYSIRSGYVKISYKNRNGVRKEGALDWRELYEILSYMVKQPFYCGEDQKKYYQETKQKADRDKMNPVHKRFFDIEDSVKANRLETRERAIANGWETKIDENGHVVSDDAVSVSVDDIQADTESQETVDFTPKQEPVQQVESLENEKNVAGQTKHNFHYNLWEMEKGGAKTRYQWNMDAIRTLKQIESENRLATPEEQKILSKFVGWGGLSQAFDEENAGWSKEYAELKELLSDEEYSAARATVNNGTHFTEMDKVLVQMENDYANQEKWQSYAENNDRATFMLLFEKDFPNMAADRYEQNAQFFRKLFDDPDMMKQVMETVGSVLYERLKKKYIFDPKSGVIEEATPETYVEDTYLTEK